MSEVKADVFALQRARNVLEEAARAIREDAPDISDADRADILASDPASCTEFELLAACARAAIEAEVQAEALSGRKAELQARQSRFLRRAERLREAITQAMQAMQERHIHLPDLSVHARAGKASVEIAEPDKIPAEYKIQIEKIDQRRVSEAVLAGAAVPGAVLCAPRPGISISRK